MKSKARSSKRKKLQRSYLGAENRSFYIQWYVLTFTELRGAKGQVLQSCLKTFGQKCDLKLWERRHRKCGEKVAPKLQQEGLSSEKSWRRKSCWLLAGSIFYRREEGRQRVALCSALILARSLSCFSSSSGEERKGVATPSSTAGEFNLCAHWHRFLKVLLFNFMTFWSVQEMTVLLSSPK